MGAFGWPHREMVLRGFTPACTKPSLLKSAPPQPDPCSRQALLSHKDSLEFAPGSSYFARQICTQIMLCSGPWVKSTFASPSAPGQGLMGVVCKNCVSIETSSHKRCSKPCRDGCDAGSTESASHIHMPLPQAGAGQDHDGKRGEKRED